MINTFFKLIDVIENELAEADQHQHPIVMKTFVATLYGAGYETGEIKALLSEAKACLKQFDGYGDILDQAIFELSSEEI